MACHSLNLRTSHLGRQTWWCRRTPHPPTPAPPIFGRHCVARVARMNIQILSLKHSRGKAEQKFLACLLRYHSFSVTLKMHQIYLIIFGHSKPLTTLHHTPSPHSSPHGPGPRRDSTTVASYSRRLDLLNPPAPILTTDGRHCMSNCRLKTKRTDMLLKHRSAYWVNINSRMFSTYRPIADTFSAGCDTGFNDSALHIHREIFIT